MTAEAAANEPVRCEGCGADLVRGGGSGRRYCSNACRQRAYRMRARTADRVVAAPELPLALDSFVGRERELAAVTALVRKGRRLVTLSGPAGVGKSRLALEVASTARRSFRDGAFVVDLAPLRRADLLAPAVAAALRVAERAGAPLVDTLAEALREVRTLVVLDNCEHLAEACGELVVSLLRRCPGLTVLATSRELLRRPGETVFVTGQLPPDDAVRLFTDRATSMVPAFALTGDNRHLVQAICRRLDNLPLAIELAARLTRLLPLADILDGLEDRFSLLKSDTVGVDAKHRDLYAAIDWSYHLLTPAERALFRRLALLPGGFDVGTAAALAVDLRSPVIELITGLEAKSLLTPVTSPATGRFRQFESIRAYAGQRLTDSGEREAAAGQVVRSLAAMAEEMVERFKTPDALVERFHLEHDNLLCALEHLHGRGDGRELLLTVALARARSQRGVVADSYERLTVALRTTDAPAAHQVLALERLAFLAGWKGDRDAALAHARDALDRARDEGVPMQCRALQVLAFAEQERGDARTAQRHMAACLARLRTLDDPHSVTLGMHNLAWVSMLAGDLAEASRLLAEALPVYSASAPPARLAELLHTAGAVELCGDDTAAAEDRFTLALRRLGDERSLVTASLFEGLALTAVRGGRLERGLWLAGAAQGLRAASGVSGGTWWGRQVTAAVAQARAGIGDEPADRALDAGRRAPLPAALAYALGQAPAADSPLTGREREVVALVAQGHTNREIAKRLRVSPRTVVSHLEHVRAKLDLRSRTQVAVWAARHAVGP